MAELRATRITRSEVEARVHIVHGYLRDGHDRQWILAEVAAKHADWGVKARAIDGYIARARSVFVEMSKVEREVELGRALARLDDLYSRQLERGDLRGATDVVHETIGLLKLTVEKGDDETSELRRFLAAIEGEAA